MQKIAIIYITKKENEHFWKKFYKTCEKYFLRNSEKQYFLFTDNKEIQVPPNVKFLEQEDFGWPLGACLKYKTVNRIKEELAEYDHIFFFEEGLEFVRPIEETEFLPNDEEGLVATKCRFCEEYQTSVWGGLRDNVIHFLRTCEKIIDDDFKDNIFPDTHDASAFRRYIIDKKHKILEKDYYNYPAWKNFFYRFNSKVKIVQRIKEK
jgi:hypothetical protein